MIRDVVVGRLREPVDAGACRSCDLEEEHDRLRREGSGPVCAEVARVQVEIPDPPAR